MSHRTVDLLELCNYSSSLQLQAGAPRFITAAGGEAFYIIWDSFHLEWNLLCLHYVIMSSTYCLSSACLPRYLQAPSAQSWQAATSASSSPRMQETHGDRWGCFFTVIILMVLPYTAILNMYIVFTTRGIAQTLFFRHEFSMNCHFSSPSSSRNLNNFD